MVDLLRNGGYILFIRHGEANVGKDLPYLNFLNCYTQRNLSEAGRRQAVTFGQQIRRLNIPIYYPAAASPFCRAVESAQLAFGRSNVVVDQSLYDIYKLSNTLTGAELLLKLSPMLEKKPPEGFNSAIVAHSFPEGVGLGPITDMGAVIVRPLGRGNGYEIVGRLSLEELVNYRG
jgi:hypothetical protein